AFDSGDAEMSREVQQIKRADGPGNGDEVNLTQPSMQDCNVADRIVLEPEKEFSARRQSLFLVACNHALPSSRMAFGAERVQRLRVVPAFSMKTELVHGDAVHTSDDATQVLIVLVELGGKYQHGVVEGELGPGRRILPKRAECTGHPF